MVSTPGKIFHRHVCLEQSLQPIIAHAVLRQRRGGQIEDGHVDFLKTPNQDLVNTPGWGKLAAARPADAQNYRPGSGDTSTSVATDFRFQGLSSMEGNDCYKFSTIRNYVTSRGARPIRTVIDIGVNIGKVTCEIATYFPEAVIHGFEPVPEYFEAARAATQHLPNVHITRKAVTAQHLYADDYGLRRRPCAIELRIIKALPASGPCWVGGSLIRSDDDAIDQTAYAKLNVPVRAETLDQVCSNVRNREGCAEIDLVKFDCEGSEHSALGCASLETLEALRFVVGEYHELRRFYEIARWKLFRTHFVNLIGNAEHGAFFAENIREGAGILNPSRDGMLSLRPWLCDMPIEWNVFLPEHVTPGEEWQHALVR